MKKFRELKLDAGKLGSGRYYDATEVDAQLSALLLVMADARDTLSVVYARAMNTFDHQEHTLVSLSQREIKMVSDALVKLATAMRQGERG